MIIQSTLTPRIIDEFDILFNGGILVPLTIDKEAGDSVDMSDPHVAVFIIAEKPSTANPDIKVPREETTIFLNQVLSVTHRVRELMPPTTEQQELFKSLHKLPTRVQ